VHDRGQLSLMQLPWHQASNPALALASNRIIPDHPFLRSNVPAVLPDGNIPPRIAIQLQFAELKGRKWKGIKMIKQLFQLQTLLIDLLKDHRLTMESGNFLARQYWIQTIEPNPLELFPFGILCFLFCSGQTSDAALVKYASPWVNKKEFSVDWLANCSVENDILRHLRPLGMQKCAQGLKDLAQAIRMLHGGRVPRDLKELVNLYGVGPKIAILTLEFGHQEWVVSLNELSGMTYFQQYHVK